MDGIELVAVIGGREHVCPTTHKAAMRLLLMFAELLNELE